MTTVTTTLATLDLLRDARRRVLSEAAHLLTLVDVPAGAVLGRQGIAAREFLLVVNGTIGVTVHGAPIALVTAGGHLGEVALLDHDDHRRRADFGALSSARLAVATRAEFGALATLTPQITRRLHRRAARRRAYLDAVGAFHQRAESQPSA